MAALCLVAGVAVFGDGGLRSNRARADEVRLLTAEADRVESANAMLRERISELQRDPEAVERLARGELSWVRDGEIVFKFKGETGGDGRTPARATVERD